MSIPSISSEVPFVVADNQWPCAAKYILIEMSTPHRFVREARSTWPPIVGSELFLKLRLCTPKLVAHARVFPGYLFLFSKGPHLRRNGELCLPLTLILTII